MRYAVDVFYFCGGVLVSLGIGMLSIPGGVIAAGVFALAASFLADRGGRGGDGAK
ncbi:MAG: hypothetical protein RSB55_10655 [Oscillospiraceae bacterium]